MINYICAALCGLYALLLVVGFVIKLKGRQYPAATEDTKHIPKPVFNIVEKIVEEEIDSWFRESARKLIAGIVYKLREKRLINDDGTAPEETTKSE